MKHQHGPYERQVDGHLVRCAECHEIVGETCDVCGGTGVPVRGAWQGSTNYPQACDACSGWAWRRYPTLVST